VQEHDTKYEEGLTTLGEEAAAALSSIRQPAVPVLASIVGDARLKSDIRRTALSALRRMMGEPKFAPIAPVLCRALTDKDEEIRCDAAAILGQLGSADESVRAALLAATADKSLWVRMRAAVSLSRFDPKNPRILGTIMPALEDKDAEIRSSGCSSLGEIGAEGATPAIGKLIHLVSDQNSTVRVYAISALSTLADQKANISAAIPALTKASKDWNSDIRRAAQNCLKQAKR
jgi:HEAT repeat protein